MSTGVSQHFDLTGLEENDFLPRCGSFLQPSGFGQIKKYVPIFTVSHLGFLMQRSLNLIKETERNIVHLTRIPQLQATTETNSLTVHQEGIHPEIRRILVIDSSKYQLPLVKRLPHSTGLACSRYNKERNHGLVLMCRRSVGFDQETIKVGCLGLLSSKSCVKLPELYNFFPESALRSCNVAPS